MSMERLIELARQIFTTIDTSDKAKLLREYNKLLYQGKHPIIYINQPELFLFKFDGEIYSKNTDYICRYNCQVLHINEYHSKDGFCQKYGDSCKVNGFPASNLTAKHCKFPHRIRGGSKILLDGKEYVDLDYSKLDYYMIKSSSNENKSNRLENENEHLRQLIKNKDSDIERLGADIRNLLFSINRKDQELLEASRQKIHNCISDHNSEKLDSIKDMLSELSHNIKTKKIKKQLDEIYNTIKTDGISVIDNI